MVAGLEEPTAGADPHRRPGHHPRQALPAAGEHGVPELRAVPPPRHLRERRLRPAPAPGRRTSRRRSTRRSTWSSCRHLARRKPPQLSGGQQQRIALARAIVNRPSGAAARRAARRARPQAAAADAAGAQADPDRGRHHLRPRDPRPGGGHDHGRHRRGHERGADRADGRTRPTSTSRPGPRSSPTSSASRTCSRGGGSAPSGDDAGRGRATGRSWACRWPAARRDDGRRAGRRPPGEDRDLRRARTSGDRRPQPLVGAVIVRRRASSACRTQYLVRMPWGAGAHGLRAEPRRRATARAAGREVACSGSRGHTFGLDAGGRRTPASRSRTRRERRDRLRRHGARLGGRRRRRGTARPHPRAAGAAALTPYLLLAARACCGWPSSSSLPIATLLGTSLQTPVPGGDIGAFQQTLRFANYFDALKAYYPQFIRSFVYAASPRSWPAHLLPAGVHDRVQGGAVAQPPAGLVIAPFFTSFILRTLAWRQILADEGSVTPTLNDAARAQSPTGRHRPLTASVRGRRRASRTTSCRS